jgi:hypothetical protein
LLPHKSETTSEGLEYADISKEGHQEVRAQTLDCNESVEGS